MKNTIKIEECETVIHDLTGKNEQERAELLGSIFGSCFPTKQENCDHHDLPG